MIQRQPGIDRIPVERAPVQQAERQPARPVEMQQQPQRSRSDWNNGNRTADPTPMQQPRQQRIERAPINRVESPRMQQAQPVPQQRVERPMMERQPPAQQQRMESPRMESPRPMPQREAPAAQPEHSERPQMGNREDGRPSRR